MEEFTDAMGMLDLIARPAFCVKDGMITKVNPAAAAHLIEAGTRIDTILQTGAEEYAAFTGGCLYLNLSVSGTSIGASVTRMQEFDVFCLEQDADNRELQAMALAARELRESLANIMITAERLFPLSAIGDDPVAQEQAAHMNRGLFQMLRVIGNMSDASRYLSDPGTHQEIRNVCALLSEIFVHAAALVADAGITLEYEGLPEPVYCLTDGEKLERAVLNMISNAAKFTGQGGSIQAKLTRRGHKLYLSVTDNGSGIPEQMRGSVFNRFSREPGVEDRRYGIGLGMVLIRATAALHGGTVLVDHPEGAGTRVTMTIAIRSENTDRVCSPVLRVDYAGEWDHGMIELSDTLSASVYRIKESQ